MNAQQRRALDRLNKFSMNAKIGRVQEARRELNVRIAKYGHRAASVTDAKRRLKQEEAELIEMTIAFFGGEK